MEKEFDHAIFKYNLEDENLVFELNNYINENINEIYSFFELKDIISKATIIILSTKEEFDKEVRPLKKEYEEYGVPSWVIGFSLKDKIYFLSLSDYKNTPHKDKIDLLAYKKTILHEYIHYIVGLYLFENKCSYPLRALNEGIAQYLSHQRDKNIITLKHDLSEVLDATTAYSEWYLITKYIIDNYSKEYFLELLRDRDKAIDFINNNFDYIKDMKQVRR